MSWPVSELTSKFSKPAVLIGGISLESPLPNFSVNWIFSWLISSPKTVKFSSYQNSFGSEVSYLEFNSSSKTFLWEGVSWSIIPSITSIPLRLTLLLASLSDPFKTKCMSSCIKGVTFFCSKAFCLFTTLSLFLPKKAILSKTLSFCLGKASL